MARKFKETRYRLEATIPLDLLVECEKIARDLKQPMSRAIERLLHSGIKYYYEEVEKARFVADLTTVKELERMKKSVST